MSVTELAFPSKRPPSPSIVFVGLVSKVSSMLLKKSCSVKQRLFLLVELKT
jgi:hypothetical protein